MPGYSPQQTSPGYTPQAAGSPTNYVQLASRLFQGVTVGDLGRAAGSKSVPFASGTETWTLVNGTANFLSANPDGLAVDANGLYMTSGSTISTGQWNGAVSGPYVYKLVSEIVPTSLWATTSFALANMYSFVDLVWIVDATSANANGELITCGYGGTSAFGEGASGRAGFAGGANSLGGATQTGAYNATAVTSASISFPGSVMPTAIRCRVSSNGQEIHVGVASGLTPPSAWYSKDSFSRTSSGNTVTATGTALNKDMVACWGIEDAIGGGSFKGIVKALYIMGQRMPSGTTLTIAA